MRHLVITHVEISLTQMFPLSNIWQWHNQSTQYILHTVVNYGLGNSWRCGGSASGWWRLGKKKFSRLVMLQSTCRPLWPLWSRFCAFLYWFSTRSKGFVTLAHLVLTHEAFRPPLHLLHSYLNYQKDSVFQGPSRLNARFCMCDYFGANCAMRALALLPRLQYFFCCSKQDCMSTPFHPKINGCWVRELSTWLYRG